MARSTAIDFNGMTPDGWANDLFHRYSRLLTKLEAIGLEQDSRTGLADAIDEETGIGGGESGTAGAHQDRELVELLQNGRDAIQEDPDSDVGTLYVEVTDTGVLVANTGSSFDIREDEVREDLRKVSRSRNKGEDAIGEKGVGLTSVCQVADAYEVWTQFENGSAGRFQCGPVNPTAAVFARTEAAKRSDEGQQALNRFLEQLPETVEPVRDWMRNSNRDISLDEVRSEDIADLPFFHYPLPLRIPGTGEEPDGALQRRAMQLVTGDEAMMTGADGEPIDFTTAVIIRFEDQDLQAIRDALGVEISDDRPEPEQLAANLWDRLRYTETDAYTDQRGQVTPESLVHFGSIRELSLRRDTDDEVAQETWLIERREHDLPEHILTDADLQVRDVRITISRAEQDDPIVRAYDHFQRMPEARPDIPERLRDEPEENDVEDDGEKRENDTGENTDESVAHVQVLVPRETETTSVGPASQSYPPYLYYPVSSAGKQFPFCLHGNFEVSKDRKELYSYSQAYNAFVLDEAASLLGDIATVAAASHATNASEALADGYPWNLLPPTPATTSDDAPSLAELAAAQDRNVNVSLLDRFCAATYSRLQTTACLPCVSTPDPVLLAEALLQANTRVVEGLLALYEVLDSVDRGDWVDQPDRIPAEEVRQLPVRGVLEAYLGWQSHPDSMNTTAWESRYESVLSPHTTGETDGQDRESFLDDWAAWMNVLLERADDQPTLVVPRDVGSDLFEGTMTLINAAAKHRETAISKILGELFETGAESEIYLLPCEIELESEPRRSSHELVGSQGVSDDATEESQQYLQLVPLERHQPDPNERQQHQFTRTVFWRGDDAPDTELPIPGSRDELGFTLDVYVVDTAVSEQQLNRDVLSAAGNQWGIVQLQSYPQYVRELLGKTGQGTSGSHAEDAEASNTELLQEGLGFFADTIRKEERGQLELTEGAYVDHDNLEKHAKYADRRRRLLNRLRARRTVVTDNVINGVDRSLPISEILLSPEWQRLRHIAESQLADDAATEPVEGEVPEERIVAARPNVAAPRLAPPEADVWGDLLDGERTRVDFARLFGTLGVSVLPGVQVLAQWETPRNGDEGWNPHKWTTPTSQQQELICVLSEVNSEIRVGAKQDRTGNGGYLDYVSSPEYGPNETAGHSGSCDVKEIRGRYTPEELLDDKFGTSFDSLDIALESWVWIPIPDGEQDLFALFGGEYVQELLTAYGDNLVETILTTGWSCQANHGPKHGWSDRIPTVLNWQLRHSTVWTETETITIPESWDEQRALGWAVAASGSGDRTSEWLPTVDVSDSSISDTVWEWLGVEPIDDLSATAAAYRLQKIQEELAPKPLTETSDRPVDLTNDRLDVQGSGWRTVYSALLTAINDYLAADDARDIDDLPFLSHFPVKAGDGWLAAPVSTIRGQEVHWFSDTQSFPWEDRSGARDGPWVLQPPVRGGSERLAEVLDCEKRQTATTRPVMNSPEPIDELAAVDPARVKEFTEELRRRLEELHPLILAALTAESPTESIDSENRERLNRAIEHLRAVSEAAFDNYLSQTGLAARETQRFGRHSAIYELDSGGADHYGLAYNLGEVDVSNPVDAETMTILTDGLQVLFERSRSTYLRLALQGQEDTLAADLPVEEIRRQLGEWSTEDFEQRLSAICELATLVGDGSIEQDVSPEDVAKTIEDPLQVGRMLAEGIFAERSVEELPEEVQPVVAGFRSLPVEYQELASRIIRGVSAGQCPCFDVATSAADISDFLAWAHTHHSAFANHWPYEQQHRENLDQIVSIWRNSDQDIRASELLEVSTWRTALRNQTIEWRWSDQPQAFSIESVRNESSSTGLRAPETWFDLTDAEVETLTELTLTALYPEPDMASIRTVLHRYVVDNRLEPEETDREESETIDLRRTAWQTVHEKPLIERTEGSDEDDSSVRVQLRGSGYGGGGGSTTDRPKFAEEAIFGQVCITLNSWIEEYDIKALGEVLDKVRDASDNSPAWHSPGRCEDLQTTGHQTSLARTIRDEIRDEQIHQEDSLTRLALVAADERGPGYDILDITGAFASPEIPTTLNPTPVEVKAVTGTGLSRVRFTVNEFRRALAFTADGIPYRLQLVRIEGGEEPPFQIDLAGSETFTEPTQLYTRLPTAELSETLEQDLDSTTVAEIAATTLDHVVKGGYLTLEL